MPRVFFSFPPNPLPANISVVQYTSWNKTMLLQYNLIIIHDQSPSPLPPAECLWKPKNSQLALRPYSVSEKSLGVSRGTILLRESLEEWPTPFSYFCERIFNPGGGSTIASQRHRGFNSNGGAMQRIRVTTASPINGFVAGVRYKTSVYPSLKEESRHGSSYLFSKAGPSIYSL